MGEVREDDGVNWFWGVVKEVGFRLGSSRGIRFGVIEGSKVD